MSLPENTRLLLVRDALDKASRRELPHSYRFRWYEPGDEQSWLRIHELSDPYTQVVPELFPAKFGTDAQLLARRQVYVLDCGNAPVGTVTAWNGVFEGEQIGRVHWLAVVPQHQRKGLGCALMSVACERLCEEGFPKAYIVTNQARLAAIRLYLSFGFQPVVRTDAEQALWDVVLRNQ